MTSLLIITVLILPYKNLTSLLAQNHQNGGHIIVKILYSVEVGGQCFHFLSSRISLNIYPIQPHECLCNNYPLLCFIFHPPLLWLSSQVTIISKIPVFFNDTWSTLTHLVLYVILCSYLKNKEHWEWNKCFSIVLGNGKRLKERKVKGMTA